MPNRLTSGWIFLAEDRRLSLTAFRFEYHRRLNTAWSKSLPGIVS
jgi:hypothetical protein